MVSCSEEQIYEMKRGPGQDSDGVRVRVRLKIQRVETRVTILRTWGQKSVSSNQMSPDVIGGAAPDLAMCEERMGESHYPEGPGTQAVWRRTPLIFSRTFYAEWEVEPGHW